MPRSRLLLLSTALAIGFAASPRAQTVPEARLNAIESQIRALQTELTRVRRDLAASQNALRTARRARPQPAAVAQAAPPPDTANAAASAPSSVAPPPSPQPAAAPGPGGFSLSAGRPTLTSPDGRFSLAVGLQLHYDLGGYFIGTDRNAQPSRLNTFGQNLRRARIPFVFKYDDFTINVTPDFGGSPDGTPTLYEASFNYAPKGTPLTATLGYFKPYLTLGDSMSSNAFLFLERPSVVEASRNIAAGDARATVGGKWAANRYFLAAYLTGGSYGSQTAALAQPQQTGGTLRAAGRPVATADTDLHLGFSASDAFRIQRTATGQTLNIQDRPELRIDQNRLVSTGALNANSAYTYGPEFALRWRNLFLQGEYIRIGVERAAGAPAAPTPDLEFSGGYVEGSWVITGSPRRYSVNDGAFNNPKVMHPLFEGGLGEFELAARYSHLDLNDRVTRGVSQTVSGGVFGGTQNVYSLGLNWYPNDVLRLMLDYDYIAVDRLNAAGTAQIGRRANALALRAQAAF